MALTKNPMILQSANRIYAWFTSKIEDNDTLKTLNNLEVVESDIKSLKHIYTIHRQEDYANFDERYKKVMGNE